MINLNNNRLCFKSILTVSFLFFQLISISQENEERKSGFNVGFNFSKPFYLNNEALDFFQKEIGLLKVDSYGFGFNFELRQYALYFASGMEYTCHRLYNEPKSLQANLDVLNGYIGIGFGWNIGKRFLIGTEIHTVGLVGFQSLSKSSDIDDLNSGFKNNEYNNLILENQFAMNVGIAPYIRIRIIKNISISVCYQYYFLNMNRLGYVSDLSLYNNYSNLSIGVVFNDVLKTPSKSRKNRNLN